MNKKIHGKLLSEFHHGIRSYKKLQNFIKVTELYQVTELFLQHGRWLVDKLIPSSTEVLYTLLVKQGTKDEI